MINIYRAFTRGEENNSIPYFMSGRTHRNWCITNLKKKIFYTLKENEDIN